MQQSLEFEDVKYQAVKNCIQIARLIALFNADQLDEFEINFSQLLSSIKPALLESEDAILINVSRVEVLKAVSSGSVLTENECLEYEAKTNEIMEGFEENLEKTSATIKTILAELTLTDFRNRETLKKLCILLDCYSQKCNYVILDSETLLASKQFEATGFQEEQMHPLIEKAMETFIGELTEEQIPRPLTVIHDFDNKMRWQQWVGECNLRLPEAEKKGDFAPGRIRAIAL